MKKIEFFRKRSGRLVKFNPQKIEDAIGRAFEEAKAVWGKPVDTIVPNFLMRKVVSLLDMDTTGVIGSPNFFVRPDSLGSRIPKLEDVQDAVEYAIRHRWEDAPQSYTSEFSELLYNLYSSYRKEREKARASLKVLNNADEKIDVTDKGMLLQENRKKTVNGWDRNRLEKDLEDLMIDNEMVSAIAKRVERAILKSGLRTVSSDLIVELVNNELTAEGIQTRMNSGRGYFIDKAFVDGLVESKSNENSNIVNNNPESINMAISGYVMKKWAMDNVFSKDVVQNHSFGFIYVHDFADACKVYALSGNTSVIVRFTGETYVMTLRTLWEKVDVPETPLNDTQVEKDLTGLIVKIRKGPEWVRVERLVLSKEKKHAKDIITKGGHSLQVTNEHAVPVLRDGKYLLVRADEIAITDKVVMLI